MDESTDTEELDDEPNTEDRAFLKDHGEGMGDGEYVPTDAEMEAVDADSFWEESKRFVKEKDEKLREGESEPNPDEGFKAPGPAEVRRQPTPDFEAAGEAEVPPEKPEKPEPEERPERKPPQRRAERDKPPEDPRRFELF